MQTVDAVDAAVDHTVSRRRRIVATALDGASAMVAVAAGSAVAIAWLLIRTGLGRTDVSESEAVTALAIVTATLPAWAAWVALRVLREGATPGQRLTGLTVTPAADSTWSRHVRLAVHPLALPLWGWLTLLALLSGQRWLWLLPFFAGVAIALAGAASFAMLLARPRRPALHDLVARTRLASRR